MSYNTYCTVSCKDNNYSEMAEMDWFVCCCYFLIKPILRANNVLQVLQKVKIR